MIFDYLILLNISLFAGAALHVNLVEQPSRNDLPINMAVHQFQTSFYRVAKYQTIYVLISSFLIIYKWFHDSNVWWLFCAGLLLSIVPFTLFCLMPINRQLLEPSAVNKSIESLNLEKYYRKLMREWNILHFVRT